MAPNSSVGSPAAAHPTAQAPSPAMNAVAASTVHIALTAVPQTRRGVSARGNTWLGAMPLVLPAGQDDR